MATLAPPESLASPEGRQLVEEQDWPLYAVLFASLGIAIGLLWDISWHRTIGRDTFWSPPHVLEQISAVVAGVSCGWVVLRTTFGGDAAARGRSVRFWGFYGPLGAWVCIWGTLMMITSAPFDDWWHNAYGLDVKIISPPHMVLAVGMVAIQIGAMLTALARQNRAAIVGGRLSLLLAASAAVLLVMHATMLMEEAAFANHMHGARFYRITAIEFPLVLAMVARVARLRWPATTAAAIYLGIELVILWTLQLVPAQPRLAPIFNPVTHMVPQPFPLLLVVPAVAIDLLVRQVRGRDWTLAAAIAISSVTLMVAAQWFFADFLLSPAARNIVFGADKWDYNVTLGDWRYDYWLIDRDAAGNWSAARFLAGTAIAIPIAAVSARIGLWLGKNMARVQR